MHGDVTSTESCTYSLAKRVEEFASVANTTRPGDFVTIVGRASTATRPKLLLIGGHVKVWGTTTPPAHNRSL